MLDNDRIYSVGGELKGKKLYGYKIKELERTSEQHADSLRDRILTKEEGETTIDFSEVRIRRVIQEYLDSITVDELCYSPASNIKIECDPKTNSVDVTWTEKPPMEKLVYSILSGKPERKRMKKEDVCLYL